jgi:hypothetical protein
VLTVGKTRDNNVKIATEMSFRIHKTLWKNLTVWTRVTRRKAILNIFAENASNWAAFVATVTSFHSLLDCTYNFIT